MAWCKATSLFTQQKLESMWVKEYGVLGEIDGAPVTDDSAHVTLTTSDLNAQSQQEKSNVLHNVLHAR